MNRKLLAELTFSAGISHDSGKFIAERLRDIATKMDEGITHGGVHDEFGSMVGTWQLVRGYQQ